MAHIILDTYRLQLREMNLSNMDALSSILQDERVMYAYNGKFDDEETMAWMQKQLQRYKEFGFGLWGVFLKRTGEMIGQCGITMQEYKAAQVPEIGYLLAYEHWHNGYAAEAAAACREYGFNTLKFNTLYSIIRDTNIASRNVALRNGMNWVDTIIKHYRGMDMPHMVFCVNRPAVLPQPAAQPSFPPAEITPDAVLRTRPPKSGEPPAARNVKSPCAPAPGEPGRG